MRFEKPVLYVLGNHEFCRSSIDGAADELKRLGAGTQVQVLDDTEVVVGHDHPSRAVIRSEEICGC